MIFMFIEDTTAVGQVNSNDEKQSKLKVEKMVAYIPRTIICPNVNKTEELVVDLRSGRVTSTLFSSTDLLYK